MSVHVLERDPLAQHDDLNAVEQLADLLRGALGRLVFRSEPYLGGFLDDLLALLVHTGVERGNGRRAVRALSLPVGEFGEELVEGLHDGPNATGAGSATVVMLVALVTLGSLVIGSAQAPLVQM